MMIIEYWVWRLGGYVVSTNGHGRKFPPAHQLAVPRMHSSPHFSAFHYSCKCVNNYDSELMIMMV